MDDIESRATKRSSCSSERGDKLLKKNSGRVSTAYRKLHGYIHYNQFKNKRHLTGELSNPNLYCGESLRKQVLQIPKPLHSLIALSYKNEKQIVLKVLFFPGQWRNSAGWRNNYQLVINVEGTIKVTNFCGNVPLNERDYPEIYNIPFVKSQYVPEDPGKWLDCRIADYDAKEQGGTTVE